MTPPATRFARTTPRLLGLVFAGALECAAPRGRAPSPPQPPPAATPPAAASTAADAGRPFCVAPSFRETKLEAAWPERDRIVACVREELGEPDGGEGKRTCVEVRSSGHYAAAAGGAPAERPLPSAPYRRASRDGRFTFEILGGRRQPHRAIGVLRDAQTGRVLKRAPVEYDEHAEVLGWIGRAVVLRFYVEEGPGDDIMWIDPQRTWPISMVSHLDEDAGVYLIDCFDGCGVYRPSDGTFAIVDASGKAVTFIDEATMAVDVVTTGRESNPEMGRRQVRWMENDGVLVIAYGAPQSGVVARIDLANKKLLSLWAAPECPSSP
jgi:hypothetical protein